MTGIKLCILCIAGFTKVYTPNVQRGGGDLPSLHYSVVQLLD